MSRSTWVKGASRSLELSPDEMAFGFRQVEQDVRAVSERELLPVNLDVPSAIAIVLEALPEIEKLRPQIVALPGLNVARFDKLRLYALALGHTHAAYRAAGGPRDRLVELAGRVSAAREMLQADAMALATRGVVEAARVITLHSGAGYKHLAFDVTSLVSLFREHWDLVASKTAVQLSELEDAERLAQQLVSAIALREQGPAVAKAAASLRQKAFTLFMRAYDEARRSVTFLRWEEDDVDDIVPSLFAGRGGRGRTRTESEPPVSR